MTCGCMVAPQTVTPRPNSPIVTPERNEDPGGRGSPEACVIYFHLPARVSFTRCPLEGAGLEACGFIGG